MASESKFLAKCPLHQPLLQSNLLLLFLQLETTALYLQRDIESDCKAYIVIYIYYPVPKASFLYVSEKDAQCSHHLV